jgi:hypothetical protein
MLFGCVLGFPHLYWARLVVLCRDDDWFFFHFSVCIFPLLRSFWISMWFVAGAECFVQNLFTAGLFVIGRVGSVSFVDKDWLVPWF